MNFFLDLHPEGEFDIFFLVDSSTTLPSSKKLSHVNEVLAMELVVKFEANLLALEPSFYLCAQIDKCQEIHHVKPTNQKAKATEELSD